ncbi:hypothetical protein H6G02_27155 [Leptolyngbya sp. FACHB-16]|nr:hypothetical protein [Leptolyngbya sp. FACHB-16]MBD2158134.1 hypothetical protein [Leptolyngbya sp. FACHB-16]
MVADEKHSWWLGERVYSAVTAAVGCFLGVSITQRADAQALAQAYGEFQVEAYQSYPEYCPQSVNTDGWEATQQAWSALFPGITLVLCFLHIVLGVQQLCRRTSVVFKRVSDKLWHLYTSGNRRQFAQRLRRLLEWAKCPENDLPDKARQKLMNLPTKAPQLKVTFALPDAYRTSNQVDRLMNYQDRILYAMQYFHGVLEAARQGLRAMALVWNFHPYSRNVQALEPHSMSPFEDLNGFRYHDNWLRNFLIASSCNGRETAKPNKHKLD